MMLKISEEQLASVGAKTQDEYFAKVADLVAENADLKSKPAVPTKPAQVYSGLSVEDVKAIVTDFLPSAVEKFCMGDNGKAIIGAQASKIAMEALASVGTQPVKSAPAPAVEAPASDALEAQGKFEESWAANKNLQAEFPDAKCYAAYRKNQSRVRIVTGGDKTHN